MCQSSDTSSVKALAVRCQSSCNLVYELLQIGVPDCCYQCKSSDIHVTCCQHICARALTHVCVRALASWMQEVEFLCKSSGKFVPELWHQICKSSDTSLCELQPDVRAPTHSWSSCESSDTPCMSSYIFCQSSDTYLFSIRRCTGGCAAHIYTLVT